MKLFDLEEEQVVEFVSLLDNFFMQINVADKLIWKYNSKEGYSVKGVYCLLIYEDQCSLDSYIYIIGNKVMPLKILLLPWTVI